MAGCGTVGGRVCVTATSSGTCTLGGPVVDRACPPGSTCQNGYCAPPTGGVACTSSQSCGADLVCDLYVTAPKTLSGVCTMRLGPKGAEQTCNTDSDCGTGICGLLNGDRECLFACGSTADCPTDCITINPMTTIEGVSTGQHKSCYF
jgi:hypothetical protein